MEQGFGVYLWHGPMNGSLRFSRVTFDGGKLWADLKRDKTGRYVSGVSVNESELTPWSEIKDRVVKHRVYGCEGVVSLYCTTESFAFRRDGLNAYVFVRWKPLGEKNQILGGWVNVNDVDFLTK